MHLKFNIMVKLMTGFILVLTLTGIIGGLALTALAYINQRYTQMYEVEITATILAQETTEDVLLISRALHIAVVYMDQPDFVAGQLQLIEQSQASVANRLSQLEALIP